MSELNEIINRLRGVDGVTWATRTEADWEYYGDVFIVGSSRVMVPTDLLADGGPVEDRAWAMRQENIATFIEHAADDIRHLLKLVQERSSDSVTSTG
ncbi:hypothetical protein [Acrocarpospora catenulata]|uniref:hypothetical protein n=1 Tax=Acrocarpospora catenulata TaxID=2836182 RepID=UPI001BDA82EA|nr:hypothetical protein [Acrocarpospora catenulata]